MSSLLFDEDVVRKKEGPRMKLGLVLESYDNTSDEDNPSDEDSDDDEPRGKKGHVLVAWYPKGRTEVVPHGQVQLHDRSLMAGDLVQRSSSNSSSGQLGTVKAVHVTCNLQTNPTKQIIYGVHSKKVQPITRIYPGTYVSLDSWVGEVEDITTEIVVELKNGARCALSENAAGKLTDVHDYSVEDSVFGESDGFFPGQILWGRSSVFKNARWLSGQQPVMSSRSHFRVVVEGVNLTKLTVNWQTTGVRDVTTTENGESAAPDSDIAGDDLQRLKPLQFFSADRIQVGDRGLYTICDGDVVSAKAVPKGSPMSYKESSNVQSKRLITIAPSAADGANRANAHQGGIISKGPTQEEVQSKDLITPPPLVTGREKQMNGDQKDSQEVTVKDAEARDIPAEMMQSEDQVSTVPPVHSEDKRMKGDQEAISEGIVDDDGGAKDVQGVQAASGLDRPGAATVQTEPCSNTVAKDLSADGTVAHGKDASGSVREGVAPGFHGLVSESAGAEVPILDRNAPGGPPDDIVSPQSNASVVGEPEKDGDDASVAEQSKTDRRGASEDVQTTSESHQLEALCNLSAQFCGEFRSLVEMTQRLRSSFPDSSEAAGEVEMRMQGFEEMHCRMQEQISKAQRLLSKVNQPASGGEAVSDAGRAAFVDKEGGIGPGLPADSVDKSSGDDASEDGMVSDVSSLSSTESDWVPRKKKQGAKRRNQDRLSTEKRGPVALGECVSVEVTHTHTVVDVEWQDGTMSRSLKASTLTPVDLLEDMHFFPGDFVSRSDDAEENVYGVVRSLDYNERTCQVCWINKPNQQSKTPRVARTEEVSIYDLIPHPDFHVHVGETVVRIGFTSLPEGESTEDKPVAGQILSITPEGMVNVTWVDGSQSAVYPQDLYALEGDGSSSSSSEDDDSDQSGDEGESDDSSKSSDTGSWETATEKSDSEDDHKDNGQGKEGGKPSGEGATGGANKSRKSPENGHKLEGEAEGSIGGRNIMDMANATIVGRPMVYGKEGDGIGDDLKGGNPKSGNKSDGAGKTGGRVGHIAENGEAKVNGVKTTDERNGDVTKSPVKGGSAMNEGAPEVQCDKCGRKTQLASAIMKDATTSTDDNPLSEGTSGMVAMATAMGAIPKATVDRSTPVVEGKKAEMVEKEQQEEAAEGEVSLGGVFTLVEATPECHHFHSTPVRPTDQKKFLTALRKEVQLLKTSLPPGIWLKGFEDKMHLFSALIEGPANTPYEDCLFYFDGHLPESYPRKPPVVHFHAFCPGKLNPNLYNEGKICLSLLDTWTGKGSEVWTKKSSLLQLLVSIQGLILNSEPYFNEAGYEKHRGSAHGTESSRMYNETALIKVIQSVTNLVVSPPEIFREETLRFYRDHAPRLISRVEGWLDLSEGDRSAVKFPDVGYPLFPLSRGFILSARQVVKNLRSRWEEVCPPADTTS